jgi:hypothetical protein
VSQNAVSPLTGGPKDLLKEGQPIQLPFSERRFTLVANPNRDLYDIVFSAPEQLVRLRNAFERESVSEQRLQIDAMLPHQLHQTPHPLLATRTESGHDLVVSQTGRKRFQWNAELAGIDSQARECSTRLNRAESQLESFLQAQSFNCDIDAFAPGRLLYLLDE